MPIINVVGEARFFLVVRLVFRVRSLRGYSATLFGSSRFPQIIPNWQKWSFTSSPVWNPT